MDISMYIHGKSVDMDGKFHIHDKPAGGRIKTIYVFSCWLYM